MTTLERGARTLPSAPGRGARSVQLLSQSPGLRTALRRAIRGKESDLVFAPFSALSGGDERSAIVIDADLPGLTGTALAERMSEASPTVPIVVVSREGPTFRMLRSRAERAGAHAVIARPDTEQPSDLKNTAQEIVDALLAEPEKSTRPSFQPTSPPRARSRPATRPSILVIASSTGGPQALLNVFGSFSPKDVRIPVLVVQHMPAAFTGALAEHITRATEWTAREAKHGDPMPVGEILIAPGGAHMLIEGKGLEKTIALSDSEPVNFCKPAADVLFVSAAQAFGTGTFALILTGMGHDGTEGGRMIKASGGRVIAQDQASSTVWGMPGAAYQAGIVERLLPLSEIGGHLTRTIAGS